MHRLSFAALLAAAPLAAPAQEHAPMVRALLDQGLAAEIATPAVIAATRARNAVHAGMSQARIDELDLQWRAEAKAGGGPLIAEVMENAVSAHLREVTARHQGLIAELFVMDAVGLNVGQSDLTSDYWQGDEAKWSKTYAVGPDAVFVDEIEFDESSQQIVSQLNFALVDPANGEAVGAVTVGVNMDMLAQ